MYPIVDLNDIIWPADLRWHLGVTGTRKRTEDGHHFPSYEQTWAMEQVVNLAVSHGAFWVHHGACTGWDEAVARYVRHAFPGLITIAHPPIKEDHLSRAAIEASHIVHEPKGYHVRDRDIAEASAFLLGGPAFAEHHPRSKYSGTWMTIRMGQNLRVPVYACDTEGNVHNVTEAA